MTTTKSTLVYTQPVSLVLLLLDLVAGVGFAGVVFSLSLSVSLSIYIYNTVYNI